MTAVTGILASGGYIPRHRLQRSAIYAVHAWFAAGLRGGAKGERAIASWDEDAITMAVEAARDLLADRCRLDIASVALASTTLPMADRSNAGVVKEALNLSDAVVTQDMTGTLRAATSALIAALRTEAQTLVLASDLRKARPASDAELAQGDAAGGVLVGQGDIVARFLGSYSESVDFVDHFRATGQDFDYAWESRWVRDEGYGKVLAGAIERGLSSIGVKAEDIDHAIVPIPVRGVPESLAKRIGLSPGSLRETLSATVGDTGTAHPLLMLAHALEIAEPGQKILLTGFGQGADVLVFETTDAIKRIRPRLGISGHLARRKPSDNYMRFLFHRGLVDFERGMRAELDQKQPGTSLFRSRRAVLGLVGGRCVRTGTVQFPKSDIGVNANDRSTSVQEDYPLADRIARVLTYTADRLTYSPDPPTFYGAIDFDGGGRMVAAFADCDDADVDVGQSMRMMFRIHAIDEQRHFKKYFWKAAPLHEGEA